MRSLIRTLGCIAIISLGSAQARAGDDFEGLARLIERTKQLTAHPSGTAIAIVRDGMVIHEGYYGFADIERKVPVTRDTVFYIASATKPFFALDMLLGEANGRLDTRTSLQQMFPGVSFTGIDAASITARDLLVHASGLENEPLVWATAFSGIHDARTRRALVAATYTDTKAPHGTFKYTNVGYNILSVWQEQASAEPWQRRLARSVFQPLGMARTSAYISEAEAAGWVLAKPYSFAAEQPDEALYLRKHDDTMQAAGGIVSTAPDLARFLLAQLGGGRSAGRAVFPPDVIARSHMPQVSTDSRYMDFKRSGYAWGWYTGEYKGHGMLHHFGSYAGFHAHLSFIPDKNIGLVVLNNEDMLSPRVTGLIADHVYGVLLGEPDSSTRAEARFAALLSQAADLQSAAGRQREVIKGRAWNLSLPLDAYVGTYSNELLGRMVVELDREGALSIRWGRLATRATGADDRDHVRVEFAPNAGHYLAFGVTEGRVASIGFADATFRRER